MESQSVNHNTVLNIKEAFVNTDRNKKDEPKLEPYRSYTETFESNLIIKSEEVDIKSEDDDCASRISIKEEDLGAKIEANMDVLDHLKQEEMSNASNLWGTNEYVTVYQNSEVKGTSVKFSDDGIKTDISTNVDESDSESINVAGYMKMDEPNLERKKLKTSDSDNDNPSEIYEAANIATISSLPEKSRQIYLKQYEIFMEWCNTHKTKNLSEEVFVAFMSEKAKCSKPATLWSTYSMLKSTVMVKSNIDISKFPNLIAFLKEQNVGYQAKKSAVFTRSDINRFLTEAPDKNYLMWKVCLIIGLAGGCRRDELRKMSINDIQDKENVLIITIPETKTGKKRVFTITDEIIENISTLQLIRKYVNLRPSHVKVQTFFINYRYGKCLSQVVGIHTFGKIPSLIAKYLRLPNADSYTGHAFRRSSASLLVEAGSDNRIGGELNTSKQD